MKKMTFGRTGEQVGQLGLGCMLMGTWTDETTSRWMLDRFADVGGNLLDTADCYAWWHRPGAGGESEEVLGRWLARSSRRDPMFLATKAGAAVANPDEAWAGSDRPGWEVTRRRNVRRVGAGGDTLRRALDGSLRRLRTDHVDLFYVHVDDRETPLEETLAALAGLVRAGKVRYLGWSNVAVWRLERIRQLCARHGWPAPVAVQQQHTYLRQRPGSSHHTIVTPEQLDYFRMHDDLTLVAYAPILKGLYDDPVKRREHWAMGPFRGPDSDARFAALDQVAAELEVTPNQLVLAWLLHQTSPPVVPLVSTRTREQYHATLSALEITLSDAQLTRLDTAGNDPATPPRPRAHPASGGTVATSTARSRCCQTTPAANADVAETFQPPRPVG